MSRQIWSKERITEAIRHLNESGFDITQSRMEARDSRLTSAAIRYFGSWRAAVEASGIDYADVAALGKQRRAEKITKWTKEKILEEIRRLNAAGEDLTSTVVRRKYLSLYATARRRDHFGSWAVALEAAGIDYGSVKKEARARRRQDINWKDQLMTDFSRADAPERAKGYRIDAGQPSAGSGWAKDLARERLAELYENGNPPETLQARQLESLIQRRRGERDGHS